jgi:sensor c-di-GMP phosphodiesterase-like protein
MTDLDEIHAALDRREFFLEYLPTMSLADGRCIGAEALIRWRRPDGVTPPQEFIPVAENTFLSGLITYWVLETVGAELGQWLAVNPDMHIAINAPPEILGRGGLAYVASKAGMAEIASQLVLEITERGVPDLIGVASINARGHVGAKVALDDVTLVGGGNMAILARSNFDIIKLDKSLIDQIAVDTPDPDWLRTVSALVHASQLVVIAEGVETEQQVLRLRAADIQAAQGFYFSRPIDARSLMTFSRDHGTMSSTIH